MAFLFVAQLMLAYFAWWRGWRGALLFWLVLPWTLLAFDRIDPSWHVFLPEAVTAAGVGFALSYLSLIGLGYIAISTPSHR